MTAEKQMLMNKLLNKLSQECERLHKELQRQEGRWLQHSNPNYSPFDGTDEHIYQCVVCGKENTKKTNYCPNCGARMKGEEE